MSDIYAAVESITSSGVGTAINVCRVLDVSRSAYYAWRDATSTSHQEHDATLLPLVRVIFKQHRRRYGARRIAVELKECGHPCSPRRVAKLLKIQGLVAIQPKSYKPRTTESNHRLGYSPNLLLDCDTPTALGQVLVGDITYIPIRGGTFSYLAALLDLFSRRIVGWHLGTDMTEGLVVAALEMALRNAVTTNGQIHHTDRGGQYAGGKYRGILRRAQMRQSMSRADDCYDNAFMESCFGKIKTELEMSEYENHRTALKEVREYISYYNMQRRHSSLGYLTPVQFEALHSRRK